MQILRPKEREQQGELIFWRCCLAQPFLVLFALAVAALSLVVGGIAVCAFALDDWRRE